MTVLDGVTSAADTGDAAKMLPASSAARSE